MNAILEGLYHVIRQQMAERDSWGLGKESRQTV